MLYKLETVNSTQKYIIEHFENLNTNDAVYAKEQTNGYGRTGVWESKEENIYFSIIKENIPYPFLYTICAMHKFCASYNKDIHIKLPNDIYYNNKKLAGFIIEKHQNKLIIGIGINIFQKESEYFTSLNVIKPINEKLNKLAEKFYSILLDTFNQEQSDLSLYFKEQSHILNKHIQFIDKKTNTIKNGTVVALDLDNITIDDMSYNIYQIKLISF